MTQLPPNTPNDFEPDDSRDSDWEVDSDGTWVGILLAAVVILMALGMIHGGHWLFSIFGGK